MSERKIYKKSEKCHLVYTPVSWNILDGEQLRDLEFVESSPNKARKIRECIRICRTNQVTFTDIQNDNLSDLLNEFHDISEDEVFSKLID